MRCGRCHTDKPDSDFAPSAVARGNGYCRKCHREYYREYARNPEKRAAQKKRALERIRLNPERSASHSRRVRNKDLRRRYGIGLVEYEARLAAQDGVCACCGTSDPGGKAFRIDHDHDTGAVRGLLCNLCNAGIGMLGDSIEGLTNALEYLARVDAARLPLATEMTDRVSVLH